MRLSAIWSEAHRNTTSGTSRAAILAIVCGGVLAVLCFVEAMTIGALVDEAERFRSSGASVITIAGPSGINGVACERLRELPDVRAAGALREGDAPFEATLLSRSPISTFEVSDGLLDVIHANVSEPSGIVVSRDVTQSLSLKAGESLRSEQADPIVSGEFDYPADGRRPGFGWAALIPAPVDEPFDECWVDIWPSNSRIQSIITATVPTPSYTASGGQIVVGQLNTTHGKSFDGAARYAERPSRYFPVVAGSIAWLIAALAIRLRRLELAARMHDGVTRPSLALMMFFEASVWLGVAALISTACGLAVALHLDSADARPLAQSILAIPLAAVVGGCVGTLTSTLSVRETQLFRYFKDR